MADASIAAVRDKSGVGAHKKALIVMRALQEC